MYSVPNLGISLLLRGAKDKETPCWIQANSLLTANEDLLPTELKGSIVTFAGSWKVLSNPHSRHFTTCASHTWHILSLTQNHCLQARQNFLLWGSSFVDQSDSNSYYLSCVALTAGWQAMIKVLLPCPLQCKHECQGENGEFGIWALPLG